MRSPTFTGRYVNTVRASVRCTPSTRMSLMTKGSMASAGSAAAAAAQARRRRRSIANALGTVTRGRFNGSAREQAVEIVVEGEEGKSEKQSEAESLSDFHRFLGDRRSLHDFGEIIHQVTPIQQGNRQEIQHAEAHAH